MLAPPQCVHVLRMWLCSQMLDPPHCLQWLRWRVCSQMLEPPHCMQLLLWRLLLADARPAAILSRPSVAVVLADPHPATVLTLASLAVVQALWRLCGHFAPLLHSASSCPRPAHSLPTLRFPGCAGSLGQSTLSLLHSLPFPLALNRFLLVFGLFLTLVFELLASLPTSLTVRSLFFLLAR